MNPQQKQPGDLLRSALLGNALFSTLSALTILLAPRRVLHLLGLSQSVSLSVVGFSLIAFAVALAVNARRLHVKTSDAWIAVVMDLVWVLGSCALLFVVPFSTSGKWIVVLVADMVLLFAILQFAGIRRIRRSELGS